MQRACVLGGGSFGTALAELLVRQGQEVRLWMRNAARAEAINSTHRNPDYLSDLVLSPGVVATATLDDAVQDADWVVVAIPSQGLRATLRAVAPKLTPRPMVLAAKGIETETLMTMDEVVIDVLGDAWRSYVLALSGPSFAQEIMLGHPTAVVLAGLDPAVTERVAPIFFCDTFRAYCSTDIVGVEMGGAVKNVMAIAAGALAGMGLGDNTRAALITRGCAEITRLAVAKGAKPLTLAGLAGVGDLILTCTGGLSRNRTLGKLLGEGYSLSEALAEIRQVVEGVRTTASAYKLARKLGVDTPITNAVHEVLYENTPVPDALLKVVRREPGWEID